MLSMIIYETVLFHFNFRKNTIIFSFCFSGPVAKVISQIHLTVNTAALISSESSLLQLNLKFKHCNRPRLYSLKLYLAYRTYLLISTYHGLCLARRL